MNFLKKWDHFWFQTYDPLSLAIFRIVTGVLIFTIYLALFPNWVRFFSARGMASFVFDDPYTIFRWANMFLPLRVFWVLGFVASIGFTIGWKTRLWTIVLFVLQISMDHRNSAIVNGEDLVLGMLLFYSCFAPLGSRLSVDSLLKPKESEEAKPRIWPVRLMQFNVAAIYFFSLGAKLKSDPAWLDGSIMYWVLANSTWSRWQWSEFVSRHMIVTWVMTYSCILVEGGLPLLVWFKRFRLPFVAAAFSFHIFIAVLLKNVTFFSLAMSFAFIVFVPGEDMEKLLKCGIRWARWGARSIRSLRLRIPATAGAGLGSDGASLGRR